MEPATFLISKTGLQFSFALDRHSIGLYYLIKFSTSIFLKYFEIYKIYLTPNSTQIYVQQNRSPFMTYLDGFFISSVT